MKSLAQRFRELRLELDGARARLVARIEPGRAPRPARRQAAKRGDGRTAKRLEALLAKAGYVVDFFVPTQGYYLHNVADCFRWEAWAWSASDTDRGDGGKWHVYSWDTMTECVRDGIVADIDEDGALCVSCLTSSGGRTTPTNDRRCGP